MRGRRQFADWMRDLHLYAGLFVSPFVLVFAVSVFFLVHRALNPAPADSTKSRVVTDLPLPPNLDQLSGRARIDALRPALDHASVPGEVGWIQHLAREQRLVIPVTVPGRSTTVTIDLARREASIRDHDTGWVGALIELHKSPGPHLVAIRMNWIPMQIWGWLADGTVYLLMLVTLSGVYLWLLLRRERRAGAAFLAAGVLSFLALVYALVP